MKAPVTTSALFVCGPQGTDEKVLAGRESMDDRADGREVTDSAPRVSHLYCQDEFNSPEDRVTLREKMQR